MKRIGLIDFDSKIVNRALMMLSSWYKAQGCEVILNPAGPAGLDHVFCSVVFTRNREKAGRLAEVFPRISFGGTGWDLASELPTEVEACRPDYDLYRVENIAPRLGGIMTAAKRRTKAEEIVNAGIGFTSRGCVRSCPFCVVPRKEGALRQVAGIGELVNPRSNRLILLDNNLTADPDCLLKLQEIKERGLVVDITQGLDVRTMTPDIARALAEIKHLRGIHYAWDRPGHEGAVMAGIETLSRFVKKWRHLCFMLVGYDTEFEEDVYRFRRLVGLGVDPYVMVWQGEGRAPANPFESLRLKHFSRWVNGRIYTACPEFDNYENWQKARAQQELQLF
jgi:hypothetical protein